MRQKRFFVMVILLWLDLRARDFMAQVSLAGWHSPTPLVAFTHARTRFVPCVILLESLPQVLLRVPSSPYFASLQRRARL